MPNIINVTYAQTGKSTTTNEMSIQERAYSAWDAHPEKTMAELYDPDKMPDDLREAHHDLDLAVERCYRSKLFTSDEERLEYLFKLYEEMTLNEHGEVMNV